jgi:hypothetical protein
MADDGLTQPTAGRGGSAVGGAGVGLCQFCQCRRDKAGTDGKARAGEDVRDAGAVVQATKAAWISCPLPVGCFDHRQDAPADGFGQVGPSVDQGGKRGVGNGRRCRLCAGFCAA